MNVLGDRFALAAFEEDGFLLDLESGFFYQLNGAASRLWRAALGGEDRAGAQALATVEGAESGRPTALTEPFTVAVESDHFVFSQAGNPIVKLDAAAAIVSPLTEAVSPAEWFHWCLPHLLLMRGQLVLHGAGVLLGGGVVGFLGLSGAGKTTTATAFAEVASRMVSEDMLLVTRSPHGFEVFLDGEAKLRRWAAGKIDRLKETGSAARVDDLARIDWGDARPLQQLVFLERQRRFGAQLELTRLRSCDALGRLFGAAFGALERRETWRWLLSESAQLVREVAAFEAVVPAGLEALQAVASAAALKVD